MKPTELQELTILEMDSLEAKLLQGLNERQVKFCRQLVIGGLSQAEAYRQSGYSGTEGAIRKSAARLMTNGNVSHYVEILRERARRLAGVDLDYMVNRHLQMARDAEAAGDRSNARKSLVEAAKLMNLYPEKVAHLNIKSDVTHDVTRISKTDWSVLREERRRREANRVH